MKKQRSKFLSLLLALAMVCSLFVPAMAAEDEAVKPYEIPDVTGKLVVIHTNDTHGHDVAVEGESIGTAGVAQLKKDFEAAGATVLLLSAGDFSQGTTLVSLDKGASAIDFMNAAGYDAAALGNHEFDYKMDALKANVEKADFPILAANIVDTETKEPIFGDRLTFDTAIGKVGVFGLDTPETMTKAHPDNVKGLTFYQGDELVACAQAQVDALKADGCTYIIAVGHLGVDAESEPNRSTDIFAKVTGVDLVVDGHSHTEMGGDTAKTVGSTLIVSTGQYLNNVGVVITDGAATSSTLVSAAQYTKVDETVAAAINAKDAEVAAELDKVFGKTEVTLNGEKAPGVRTQETNLGDFAADAILWGARQALGEDKVDAALTNGGGIRATIPAGDITMNTMKTVFPFGNEVATIDVTGAELLEALEAATFTTPTAIGAFPQVSGIEFSIDTSAAYAKGEVYKDTEGKETTYFAPAEIRRVTIATVNGEAFDAEATYTLATNDFTAAGGDTYGVFVGKTMYKTGVALEDALVNYTKDVLDGTIPAATYAEPAGRITIKYVGVEPGKWYVDAARYVMDEGIMSSAGKNGFLPGGTVTRGTVFQTLYNMAGAPAAGETTFTDVSGKWYASAAAWAESTGLAVVPANGLFNGDREITRAEIATIIERYATDVADLRAPEGGMAMKEAPDYDAIGSWALEGMSWCYYSGVVTGKSGNLLDPNGTAVRAELAQILLNLSKVPANYVEETVAIEVPAQNGVPAHTINGILTLPADASKDAAVPGIVMLHGTGSNMHEVNGGYDMAAAQMAKEGLATLRFDFMGIGDGNEADYVNYSYTSANIDAKAAADYLAKLDAVDGDKLGVMGWSQGGTNALLAAAKYPDTFKSVVTWAGALDLKTMVGDFDAAAATAAKDGSWTMKFDWRTDLPFGSQWFKDVKSTDVLAQSKKIAAPILTINGEKDDVVDPASGKTIADAAKNPRSYNLLVKDCDHTFNMFTGDYTAINTAISATAKYFNDTLTADYMEIPVTVKNGERDVPAIVTLPAGNGAFPAVVMNHGHGGSKDENVGFVGIAAALAKEGIASIRMDFPGCGDSTEPFTEENLTNRVSDSNACKDYLVANYPVNKAKLGILGYSMGGRTAALIVGERNNPYKAMVLLAGAVGDGQTLAENMAGGAENYEAAYNTAKTEGKYTITTQYGQVQDLSQKWFDDMAASKPLDGAKNFTGPVLVMYGDQDTVVPADVNKLSLEAYKNATEIVVKDADHGYGFYSDQSAVTEIVEGGISSFFAESFGLATADKAA